MIKEVSQVLPVLGALIVANIAAGTVNSMAVEKTNFDKKRMIEGIIKAIVAAASVFALTYACDTVDLSGLGFTPMTIINTGILVYAAKLGINLVKILGLDKHVKIADPGENLK